MSSFTVAYIMVMLFAIFRSGVVMHFAVTVRKRLEGCVPNARKENRHLRRHPWAASTFAHMLEEGKCH